jgi:hypothetical protein
MFIQFRPLITVENQELIYRISLHHCKNVKQARKEASECFEFDELKCHELVLAWGYGSEGLTVYKLLIDPL